MANSRILPCPYQKLVRSGMLEDFCSVRSISSAMLNVLWCLLATARSLLKAQRELALENLALRHQIGLLTRALGKRRLSIKSWDRGLWMVLSRLWWWRRTDLS